MTTLIQNLRYGLRVLTKNPGFTTVAVLTLSLGIRANTAIFSVVYGALLRHVYEFPDNTVNGSKSGRAFSHANPRSSEFGESRCMLCSNE